MEGRDAAPDGRAIRWMIAAGSPGLSLVDPARGEDANLATAQAMRDMQRAFPAPAPGLLRLRAGRRRGLRLPPSPRAAPSTTKTWQVDAPDISPEDNIQPPRRSSFLLELQPHEHRHRALADLAGAGGALVREVSGRAHREEEIRQIIEEGQANAAMAQAAPRNAEEHAEDVEQRGANTPRSVKHSFDAGQRGLLTQRRKGAKERREQRGEAKGRVMGESNRGISAFNASERAKKSDARKGAKGTQRTRWTCRVSSSTTEA